MRHIGVDLHKTNFVACFLAAADTQRLETYPLTREGLSRFTRQLKKVDEVAVEATQNVHYFYDQVKGRVSRVAVMDTYRFRVVAKSKKKTDKADARGAGALAPPGVAAGSARPFRAGEDLAAVASSARDIGLDADEAQEHGARGAVS